MDDFALQAAERIQKALHQNFVPKIGLILGSGLAPLAEQIEVVAEFNYQDLPGFAVSKVAGHASRLILGYLNGVSIACLSGRVHIYEGLPAQEICTPIRTLKQLGVEILILTNAAGGIHADYVPGDVVMISDQINLTGTSALVGLNNPSYGPRFVPMDNAFDAKLREKFHAEAKARQIVLREGVYVGVLGPAYETPAEIRMFRILGGDLIGMSTVNETIVARHAGMKVVGLSAIANVAAGLSDQPVNHEEVLEFGQIASRKMATLLIHTLPQLKVE